MTAIEQKALSARDSLRLSDLAGALTTLRAARGSWSRALSSGAEVDGRDLDALEDRIDGLFTRLSDERDFLVRVLREVGNDALEEMLQGPTLSARLDEAEFAKVSEILHRHGTILETAEEIAAALPGSLAELRSTLRAQREGSRDGAGVLRFHSESMCHAASIEMMMVVICPVCGVGGAIEAAIVC